MLYFWTVLIIFLTIIEAATVELVTIWFIMSAVAALIVSIFVDNLVIQFGVFVILGVILLITTRPFLVKLLNNSRSNIDKHIKLGDILVNNSVVKTGYSLKEGDIIEAYIMEQIK